MKFKIVVEESRLLIWDVVAEDAETALRMVLEAHEDPDELPPNGAEVRWSCETTHVDRVELQGTEVMSRQHINQVMDDFYEEVETP